MTIGRVIDLLARVVSAHDVARHSATTSRLFRRSSSSTWLCRSRRFAAGALAFAREIDLDRGDLVAQMNVAEPARTAGAEARDRGPRQTTGQFCSHRG